MGPEFRFAEALAPYARRRLLSDITPPAVIRRLEGFGVDLGELAVELPSRLNRISGAIAADGFEINVRTDEMDALLARTERLSNPRRRERARRGCDQRPRPADDVAARPSVSAAGQGIRTIFPCMWPASSSMNAARTSSSG